MATYDTAIYSEAADLPATKGHRYIRTHNDDKSLRLNNRDYDGTGEYNAVQSKPNITTNTGSACSFEASPRADDGISVGHLIGFKSNPIMKTGAGNLTGAMRCLEAKLESDDDYTGSIDEAYGLEVMHAMHGTVNATYPLSLKNAGGGTGWTHGFMLVGSNFAASTSNASTNAGYLKVSYGTAASPTAAYIQLYSTTA